MDQNEHANTNDSTNHAPEIGTSSKTGISSEVTYTEQCYIFSYLVCLSGNELAIFPLQIQESIAMV